MAVTKTVLKNTESMAVVKVAGTAGSATISLASDLLSPTQELNGSTQTVNLVGANWTGARNGAIEVARNEVAILTIPADQPQIFDFQGDGYVDTVENTQDITVTISGAESQVYLTLRKANGYKSKIETSVFSQYDDETKAGE